MRFHFALKSKLVGKNLPGQFLGRPPSPICFCFCPAGSPEADARFNYFDNGGGGAANPPIHEATESKWGLKKWTQTNHLIYYSAQRRLRRR